ncbi:MAG TPA: hypothetical protein EYP24_00030 [bacterium (Candidatus Stahlbacteria)]|nr:hypothetical protein [Candidatus Stahlbacteria bacterium]
MRILALADLHGKETEPVGQHLDLIAIAGDITTFGGYDEAREVLERVVAEKIRVIGVPGNCDYPGVGEYLDEIGANCDQRSIKIGDILFIGLGGSNTTPCNTPNENHEDELRRRLAIGVNNDDRLVLISHPPPYGTLVDRTVGGSHVGSKAVRSFIEEYQPELAVCGHIHEAKGEDSIGRTRIINPGPNPGFTVDI